MNWLDIVIILLLVFAVWQGWRQGVITQVLGLAAVVLGIFLGWKYGEAIGAWLGVGSGSEDGSGGPAAAVVGFIVVLVLVILAVFLIGRLTRGLFRMVGMGVFDNILGMVFSALKMIVFVGLVFLLLEVADPAGKVIPGRVREGSVMYGVVSRVNDVVFPFVGDMFR